MSTTMGPEHCTRCTAQLEEGQIGLCDDCQDGGRTRIGNTPTCETCGEPMCICDETDNFGNVQRAASAHRAVEYFADICGEIGEGKSLLEQNITDLLADLAHLCDREDLSLTSILTTAENHYNEETNNTGRQFEEYTPTTPHVTGLKEQLGAAFPWLTTEDEDEVSGADTIDQLQQFYDNLGDDAPATPTPDPNMPTRHAQGIVGLTIGTDQQFLNAASTAQRAYWDAIVDLNCALGTKFDAADAPSFEGMTVEALRDGTHSGNEEDNDPFNFIKNGIC